MVIKRSNAAAGLASVDQFGHEWALRRGRRYLVPTYVPRENKRTRQPDTTWRSVTMSASGFRGGCRWESSRMSDGDVHVVKRGDDWTVTVEGIKGDLVSYDTEDEAIRSARRVAAAARSDVVLDDDPRLADNARI